MDKLSLGSPSTYLNLTLTPILANAPLLAIEPRSLEEALADGTAKVTEVSAAGHVPELRVKNSGATPVLILDGEELVGAKQNRIVNVTILVPPQSEIVIPVSCIEAGRWAYARPGFASAGRVLHHKLRSRKAESVSKNLKEHRRRRCHVKQFYCRNVVTRSVRHSCFQCLSHSDEHQNRPNFV